MGYDDINKGDDNDSDNDNNINSCDDDNNINYALKGKRTFIHIKCYNSFNNQIQLS